MVELEVVGDEVADEVLPLVDADVVEFDTVADPPINVKNWL